MSKIAFQGEVQLLSWSETHRGGAKVVLQLQSADDLDAFRSMTVRQGKVAGQRLACVMVEIDDQEQPVEQEHGPKRSQIAYLLCEDGDFVRWVNASEWGVHVTDHATARSYICTRCGVSSRSELDRSPVAAAKFDEMRNDFQEYKDQAFRARVAA
jgi:hypothetical protein